MGAISVGSAVLAAAIAVAPAAPPSSAFEAALESGRASASAMVARQRVLAELSSRMAKRLGPFAVLLAADGSDEERMSAEVSRRLSAGEEDALVLGESHGDALEVAAGLRFLRDAFAAGVKLKALLREENIFEGDRLMADHGVPLVTFRNQFRPQPEVGAALAAPGDGLVATYTGHAHTAAALKDYFLYTLEEGKMWGYEPGKKDMPTVEDAFRGARRRPLIVAMITEQRVLRRVQALFLREISSAGGNLDSARSALEDLRTVWDRSVPQAAPSRELRFMNLGSGGALFVGLRAGSRRPDETDALLDVMSSPDARAWAGADPLKGFEALWGSGPGPDGRPDVFYNVVLRKASGQEYARAWRRDGGISRVTKAAAAASFPGY